MVELEHLKTLINHRITRILLAAEIGLSESKFRAYRKYVLDEFGKNGLEKELNRIGSGRNRSSKEGVHHD